MRYNRIIGFEDIKVSVLMILANISKCFIAAICLLFCCTLFTLTKSVDNFYSASTTLYYPLNGTISESADYALVVSSYTSLIQSQKVAERAVSILGNTSLTYNDIQNMVSYSSSSNGINLTISAMSTKPEEAVAVANAVANAFSEEMRTMTDTDNVRILSTATGASVAHNGIADLWMTRLLAFIVGFILMAVFIFIRELFSDKIRTIDQCIITDDDVILGVIPNIKENNGK